MIDSPPSLLLDLRSDWLYSCERSARLPDTCALDQGSDVTPRALRGIPSPAAHRPSWTDRTQFMRIGPLRISVRKGFPFYIAST
jgi:hypothetical protein